jgi:transcriptional regulator with XRE-family HTH domain
MSNTHPQKMNTHTSAAGLSHTLKVADAETVQAQLLTQLAAARHTLGLTQAQVGERIGRTRMTVHRAEAENAGVALSTFVELALALNLAPQLVNSAGISVPAIAPQPAMAEPEVVEHRGASYNRTQHNLDWRDRQREAAFAQAWESSNESAMAGLRPVMDTLVPNHTQAQASAVATVVQWMGSEVGFHFLVHALSNAGYQVADTKAA